MRTLLPTILLLCAIGCAAGHRGATPRDAAAASGDSPATQVSRRPINEAIRDGVAYLVASQNPDGSWGTGVVTTGFEISHSVPGSHDAFRIATTSLAMMALREAGETQAHDRALRYLVEHGTSQRETSDLIYSIWAHVYATHALALEQQARPDDAVARALAYHIGQLQQYQTYVGGWNYYDFRIGAQEPAMEPTSFGTAAGLVGLWEARKAGAQVPQLMVDRSLRRLAEMRLPNGSFLYSGDMRFRPRQDANQMRGSIGRNQACNFALWQWDFGTVDAAKSVAGLDEFFREHDYIQMGRKRPLPHSSWYQTAPYYYYFGHYYAARLIERLGPQAKAHYGGQLAETILPYQEPDGSWWDYPLWDYHKPYGTAFAIMTLLRCR